MFSKKLRKSANIVLYGIFSFHFIELFSLGMYCILENKKLNLNKKYIIPPLIGLAFVFVYGLISYHFLNYDITKLLQQSSVLAAFIFLYAIYFSTNRINLPHLFKKYLLVCYYVSVLGFVQLFIYAFFQIDIFYFSTWLGETQFIAPEIIRPRSFCPEPGHLGTLLSPAIVYIIYFKDKWKILKKKGIVILTIAMLSMSMTAIISICGALYFRYISKRKIIDWIVFFMIILWGVSFFVTASQHVNIKKTSAANIDGIKMRIFETGSLLFSYDDINAIENTNSSTYALMSNFYVAMKAPQRLLGTGLGSHQYNYFKFYPSVSYYAYGLNSADGYSLFNRIFSEFGILGLSLYLFFIFRHIDRHDVISFSLLFYIIGSIIRGGNYFVSGLIFFHFFFFVAKEQYVTIKYSIIKDDQNIGITDE